MFAIISASASAEWIEFEITAYTTAKDECGECAGCCALTNKLAVVGRTIAVDTRVVPAMSRVYIQDIGWRIAEDTGSAIVGKKIDLLVDTKWQAFNVGRRKMWCYIERR